MKIGFISDIHEDIISLKKGLDLLEERGVDQVICLGDITGFSNPYYPFGSTKNANACIELVRDLCSVVIPGNHDLFTAGRIPEHTAGVVYPDNWFALEMHERMAVMKGKIWLYENEIVPELSTHNIEYLRALPEYTVEIIDGIKMMFSHFLFPDISGSLRKRIDDIYDYRDHFLFMHQHQCLLSFGGHMHKEGFETVNVFGLAEYGFSKKRLKNTTTFIGLPSLAGGKNKNGVAIFDTERFEMQSIRVQ